MSIYVVQKDYELPPDVDWEDPSFKDGGWLVAGERLEDGQLEPDVVADLLYRGVLVHEFPFVKPLADQPDIVRAYEYDALGVAVAQVDSPESSAVSEPVSPDEDVFEDENVEDDDE